jgi:hypothetical protein
VSDKIEARASYVGYESGIFPGVVESDPSEVVPFERPGFSAPVVVHAFLRQSNLRSAVAGTKPCKGEAPESEKLGRGSEQQAPPTAREAAQCRSDEEESAEFDCARHEFE